MTMTQNGSLAIDDNDKPVMGGTSSSDNATIINASFDPITRRLLTDSAGGGSGTVTSVSVVTANGFAGSVADATTTPAITLSTTVTGVLKGNGTAVSAALNSDLPVMTATVGGAVPTPPNNTTTFLRGDGTFASPSASAPTVITVENEATDTSCFLGFFTAATGDLGPKTNANLTFNSNTGVLTLVAPILGTPTSVTLTNATGLPVSSGISGLGTGVATALAVNVGTAGAFVVNGGALGTPSSGTVTNLTGTASININGTVGATTPTTGVFTTLVASSTTSLLLGTAGSAVGNIGFRNGTSGTITLAPVAGALGTVTLTLPAATDTVAVLAASQAFTNKTYNGNTWTAGTGVLTIAAAKTLTVNNTIALTGTDSTTMTFPSTSATIARTDAGQTFTGTQVLAENASIQLDPAGSADGKFTGITVTATAGYTQAFGDLVYLAVADSRWELADADALATAGNVALAMVVVAGTDGAACTLLLQGIIRADAKFPTMTVGATQYVGETAGAIQGTIPTGADNIIRTVGYALTADELYFNPSTDWQVTVA